MKISSLRPIFLFLVITLFASLFLVGCQVNEVQNPSIDKAKRIYKHITFVQYDPNEDQLLRTDWPGVPHVLMESSYQYIVPYVPYAVYNALLFYPKELLLLPVSPIPGMTDVHNKIDRNIEKEALSYEDLFYKLWTQEHANLINMDRES